MLEQANCIFTITTKDHSLMDEIRQHCLDNNIYHSVHLAPEKLERWEITFWELKDKDAILVKFSGRG